YLYCWYDIHFPHSENINSVSVYISPVMMASPLWEDLYSEDWDSVLSFRGLGVTKVDIRISPDKKNVPNFSSDEKEIIINFFQDLIHKEFGPNIELVPPKQYFVDFLEVFRKRSEIQKRFPLEMQEGYFPVVGLPKDRNEIDLGISITNPVFESIEYQIQITDSANKPIEHQLYVSNRYDHRDLDKIIVPRSKDSTTIDTYVYHIRLDQPELVHKISFIRNNAKEYLIYQKGEETCSGYLMKDFSSISNQK
ncbi:MAG: hypothetical protein KDE26_29875, partial [Bacteroidetes bacterium]|nr:hypothetical protein [Bacteroidota bacterium]